jgi:hypothetical protein
MLEPLPPTVGSTVSPPPADARAAAAVARARRWVHLLEECFRLPGTRLRFGLEAIVGLVPGVGDLLGLAGGLPILLEALRRRASWRVLLFMTVNLLVDAVLGSVPVVGDAFDLVWKANRKNLTLLEDPAALRGVLREARSKIAVLVLVAFVLLVVLAVVLAGLLWAVERATTLR